MNIRPSLNHDYVFENAETSRDLTFPQCRRSSKTKSVDEMCRGYKNLLLVSKDVNNEASEHYLKQCLFFIKSNTCITQAKFAQCQPIDKIAWEDDITNIFQQKQISRLAKITTTFANNHTLRLLEVSCNLDTANRYHKATAMIIFVYLIQNLKELHALLIRINVILTDSGTKKQTFYGIITESTGRTKGPFERFHLLGGTLMDTRIVYDWFIVALMMTEEHLTSRVVTFWHHPSLVERANGLERDKEIHMHQVDIDHLLDVHGWRDDE